MEKRLCLLSEQKVGYPHPKPGTFTGRPARTIGVGQPYVQFRTVGVLHREQDRIVEFHKGFLHWSYGIPESV